MILFPLRAENHQNMFLLKEHLKKEASLSNHRTQWANFGDRSFSDLTAQSNHHPPEGNTTFWDGITLVSLQTHEAQNKSVQTRASLQKWGGPKATTNTFYPKTRPKIRNSRRISFVSVALFLNIKHVVFHVLSDFIFFCRPAQSAGYTVSSLQNYSFANLRTPHVCFLMFLVGFTTPRHRTCPINKTNLPHITSTPSQSPSHFVVPCFPHVFL